MTAVIKTRLAELGISINDCVIHNDGTVDVNGDVNLSYRTFPSFGIKFGKVAGDFDCSGCIFLTTLTGAPTVVTGDFICFTCNLLESLVGAPTEVGGNFIVDNCKSISSLAGLSTAIGGDLICGFCENLVTLHDIHKQVRRLGGSFRCSGNNVKSSVLGLTMIPGISNVVAIGQWGKLVNEHLHNTIACQSALLDMGLEEYAKL